VYKKKTIAVIIPAFNEEKLIGQVVRTVPKFVDWIVIINDCSQDKTSAVVKKLIKDIDRKIVLIQHEKNQGVGGAIVSGYKWCRDHHIDVSVVMAGDAQMDPTDLPALLDPVVSGQADYTKGNRLVSGEAWEKIPHIRYLGNATLSMLTKIASGYWHVADSQTGYTAAGINVLRTIDLDSIYKGYGMPNDMLVRLNIHDFRVKDVPVKPIYGIGEKSGIRPILIIPKLLWLLFTLFIKRLNQKYIIRDFHPLVIFYLTGSLLTFVGIIFGFYVLTYRLFIGPLMDNSPIFTAFLLISGWQFILFGMWFDMEYNKELK
jgi:glycosyltransferase involved in cell wall biosynthesis